MALLSLMTSFFLFYGSRREKMTWWTWSPARYGCLEQGICWILWDTFTGRY